MDKALIWAQWSRCDNCHNKICVLENNGAIAARIKINYKKNSQKLKYIQIAVVIYKIIIKKDRKKNDMKAHT